MRAVSLFFATALLMATALLACCGIERADRDAAELVRRCTESTPSAPCSEPGRALARTRWGLVAGAITALLLCGAAWTRRGQTALSVLLLSTCAAAAWLAPRYHLGPTSPGSARGLALVVAIVAFIAIASLPERRRRDQVSRPARTRGRATYPTSR